MSSLLKRLEKRQENLDEVADKLEEKLGKLRTRQAIETDTAEQFKLEELINEHEEKLKEIEKKIEDIDQKINSYKRGEHHINDEKTQNYDDLYKALLKLGYWEQQRLFEKIIITKKESHGAFLIHGKSKHYGQRWLLNRLALVIANSLEGKNIAIDLYQTGKRTDMLGIWEELAGWVDLEESSPPAIIVDRILKLWRNQNVLIKFDNVDLSIEDNLRDLINILWQDISHKISDTQSPISRYKLLIFFLDCQGFVINWNLGFVNDYDPKWKTNFPFNLPELIPFSGEVIRTWLEQQSDRLPEKISLNKEETVRILWEKKGIPVPTFHKICTLYGCNWFEQQNKWLRL